MSLGHAPVIFNQQLLHHHLRRAAGGDISKDFLRQRVAEDIASRLSLIKREFKLCTLFGDKSDCMVSALERLPNLHELVSVSTIDPVGLFAPKQLIVGSEEHLAFKNESINLAISPLTLQFANDLPGALIQLKRSLKPDGLFIGAFLGGDSLVELRDALLSAEIDIRGGAAPRVHARVDIRDLGTLLQRAGFALPVVDSDRITVTYRSTLHLMHDLRALGFTSILVQDGYAGLNRHILKRLEDIYQERYPAADNRIRATFEIIYLTGWAPHENQQKPLKPGSAKTRLADVFKTEEISVSDDRIE